MLLRLQARGPTLSMRKPCREGVCGSDAMNLNGQKRFGLYHMSKRGAAAPRCPRTNHGLYAKHAHARTCLTTSHLTSTVAPPHHAGAAKAAQTGPPARPASPRQPRCLFAPKRSCPRAPGPLAHGGAAAAPCAGHRCAARARAHRHALRNPAQPPLLRIQSAVFRKLSARRVRSASGTAHSPIAWSMQATHWSRSWMPMENGRWRWRRRGWPKRSW